MVKSNLDKDKEELIKVIKSAPNYQVLYEGLGKVVDKRRELSRYIWLPESSSHPELLIAQEVTDQGYTHKKTNKILEKADSFMPTPDLLAEFLRTCKSGKAYDGNKDKIPKGRLDKILEERGERRNPWRLEHLDHQYSLNKKGQLQVTYHKFLDGKINLVTELLDPETLMKDRLPGISLDSYLGNPTSQGLPRKSVKEGSLWYWFPRKNNVAGFNADADGAYLYCIGGASVSGDSLGVRRAKIFSKK